MIVSLLIISLSAQQRWLFIILLSSFTGLCAYMMGGKRANYFWQVSGFVTAIICIDGGPDPENAFSTAILRAQETWHGYSRLYPGVFLYLAKTQQSCVLRCL
jgi:uncharacterized membrane protein YccC